NAAIDQQVARFRDEEGRGLDDQDLRDQLATLLDPAAPPLHISASVYRLSDATPLVGSCGKEGPPRFQVLELTPRIGASFDPATADDRALALLDVETGTLAFTSRKVPGMRRLGAPRAPICRDGRYFLPLTFDRASGAESSALWIVNAQTGKTEAAVAFQGGLAAPLRDLTADHLEGERLIGVADGQPHESSWRTPAGALRDARRELEEHLGPLP
ncbi:MAG TPA: hypothetical protein PKU97_21880, partial [Kofleriaceae bacterium]|nr:hypothetical protein [Kofleriaceae bacterium]